MGYPTPPPYPPYPPYPPAPPQRSAADVVVSIVLMAVIVMVGGFGALMGLFSLGFLDKCPPATCSVEGAVTASMATVAIAALVVLTGCILTIIRLATRKSAWPFALGTLGLTLAVFVIGGFAYSAAVT